jgi:hypothetical protein
MASGDNIFEKKVTMTRKDLLTGEVFNPKRVNQKFATPLNRVTFHNKKANELRQALAYISKPLHLNIRILNELMTGKKESTFHKEFLKGKGFSFEVHNHVKRYDNKNHFAIYQYVVIPLGNDQIKIIAND